jgi:uncharacterized membrane protein YccC
MNPATARHHFFRERHARYGLQLATAIALAWVVSTLLGLPESHWAVMSVLIVSRADAGATLGAGGQRMAATLGGALVGLAGTALAQLHVLSASWLAPALVMGMAVGTADRAGLRSAVITTLIVMTAVGRPGVSPLAVAGLRVMEIAVGVGMAMAIAWLAHRPGATSRPTAVLATLLRDLAAQMAAAAEGDDARRESFATTARTTVRRLGEMMHGAKPDAHGRRMLPLGVRLGQDVSALVRQWSAVQQSNAEHARAAADAAVAALRSTADRIEGGADDSTAATTALGALKAHGGDAWRPDVLLLLQDDLRKMLYLSAEAAMKPP